MCLAVSLLCSENPKLGWWPETLGALSSTLSLPVLPSRKATVHGDLFGCLVLVTVFPLCVYVEAGSWDRVSYGLDWWQTCYMAKNGLELLTFLPPPPSAGITDLGHHIQSGPGSSFTCDSRIVGEGKPNRTARARVACRGNRLSIQGFPHHSAGAPPPQRRSPVPSQPLSPQLSAVCTPRMCSP